MLDGDALASAMRFGSVAHEVYGGVARNATCVGFLVVGADLSQVQSLSTCATRPAKLLSWRVTALRLSAAVARSKVIAAATQTSTAWLELTSEQWHGRKVGVTWDA